MEEETNTGVYELGLHLVSDMSVEDVPARFGDIKSGIESLGGVIVSDEMPKDMALTYEMRATIDNKAQYFTRSYFGWVKFEMSADTIAKVKEMIESRSDIIRFIIVSTVKENTLSPRKLFEKKEGGIRRKKDEKVVPVDAEAVDAELDKMLVEEGSEVVSESVIDEVEEAIKD